jgi:hypothetical protein
MTRRVEPEFIRRAVAALLIEYPELAEDEDLRRDVIEGETDAFETLSVVLGDVRNAQTLQAAIRERIEALRSRLARFERREEFSRKLLMRIMEAATLRKAVLPEATLSIRPAPPALRIIEESFIPAEFWRVKREPDGQKIKAALKAGADVPGAALSNAADTLAILCK